MKAFNKKAQLGAIGEVGENMLKLIFVGMILIIVFFIALSIYGAINGSSIITTPEAQAMFDVLDTMPALFDWAFMFLFGGMTIASLVFFSLREFSPIEYIISWLFTIVFSFMIFILGYVGQTFIQSSAFSTVISKITFIPFFMDNSFLFSSLYFVFALLAMHTTKT